MPLLRVFDVPPHPAGGTSLPPVERKDRIEVEGTDNTAKRNARAVLESSGLEVRSMNWGPDERGIPELIAYVTKKERA